MVRIERKSRLTSWLAYPSVMAIGLLIQSAGGRIGFGIRTSSYLAVAAGASAIVGLEAWRPYRRRWRPTRHEVGGDLAFLLGVQIILPLVLALGASTALTNRSHGPWPHAWPVAAQFLLMLGAADFLRYWLHVAAHRVPWLWRLHALHHAPAKLNASNVSRFHPLERTLQYLAEGLPFAALGVDERVLAAYFLFHSLHGFLQHANIDVRLGPLNYLLSGPELHRWHHSRCVDESQSNFANHLALWDVLFGTYFRPRAKHVRDLGLAAGRPASSTAVSAAREMLLGVLLRIRVTMLHWLAWRPLLAATRDPRRAQMATLRRMLARNRDSRFGREHGFDSIRTYDDYRARVAVQDYESLRPYIERHDRAGTSELTRDRPIMYAQTSGTTGGPKCIPVTRAALARLARSQNLFFYLQYRAMPEAFRGRILAVASAACEGTLPSGTPFGSASGHLYAHMPKLARAKYVVPPEVFTVDDYALRYELVLRLALVEPRITAGATANPSTFLHLLDTLRGSRARILADLDHGHLGIDARLPAPVAAAVASRLQCAPERVERLRAVLRHDAPTFADLWPDLALVTTWTGGSCGIALERLRTVLPARTRVVELGYLASECRGTLTVDPSSRGGLPTLDDTFFEFVDTQRWEDGDPEFLTLDRLDDGQEYYVLVTTAGGLYRYFMNDIVRVVGRLHATPLLAFVQKGKGVTSITGEKLYECQVIDAVRAATVELGSASRFFVALADVEHASYRLLIERDAAFDPDAGRLATRVDELLATRNVEYADKRASGRLAPLSVHLMRPGFGESYKAWCVARGQREGQFKSIALQYSADFGFPDAGDDTSGTWEARA